MIAKVCDRESRRDTENRLVDFITSPAGVSAFVESLSDAAYNSIAYMTISFRILKTPHLDVPNTIRDQQASQVGLETS